MGDLNDWRGGLALPVRHGKLLHHLRLQTKTTTTYVYKLWRSQMNQRQSVENPLTIQPIL